MNDAATAAVQRRRLLSELDDANTRVKQLEAGAKLSAQALIRLQEEVKRTQQELEALRRTCQGCPSASAAATATDGPAPGATQPAHTAGVGAAHDEL